MNNVQSSNKSTEKAFAVLEFLVGQSEPMKLLDIAKHLNMNASTASRYLASLINCGYVDEDSENFRYSASTKICELSNILLSRFQLAGFIHPYLQKASDYFDETACLSIERNNTLIYIDIVLSSSKTLMNVQRVGNSAPLHSTAAGKLFLSKFSCEELDYYIQEKTLKRYTDKTITDKAALVTELDMVRKNGFSEDVSENEPDIHCLAYPIYDSKQNIVACLGITGPASRFTSEVISSKQAFLAELTCDISQKLSALGYFKT